jgi:hypothetical protein
MVLSANHNAGISSYTRNHPILVVSGVFVKTGLLYYYRPSVSSRS